MQPAEIRTHNAAYMILDAKTSLLPISLCRISTSVKPAVSALFVPQTRTTCTNPIRIMSGMILNAMILSSGNNRSVRIYRPQIRTRIITNEKPVHHQLSKRVGLSSSLVCAGGGSVEYNRRTRLMADLDAHPPPQRGERDSEGLRRCSGWNVDVGLNCSSEYEVWTIHPRHMDHRPGFGDPLGSERYRRTRTGLHHDEED